MSTIVKSLTNRNRNNVDDMGLVLTGVIVLLSLAWTLS